MNLKERKRQNAGYRLLRQSHANHNNYVQYRDSRRGWRDVRKVKAKAGAA